DGVLVQASKFLWDERCDGSVIPRPVNIGAELDQLTVANFMLPDCKGLKCKFN
ncbi:hypothetical protein A2U01_0069574, partial [Trifolium medium]|nr:hypothetical protein [Trifolium medium]